MDYLTEGVGGEEGAVAEEEVGTTADDGETNLPATLTDAVGGGDISLAITAVVVASTVVTGAEEQLLAKPLPPLEENDGMVEVDSKLLPLTVVVGLKKTEEEEAEEGEC